MDFAFGHPLVVLAIDNVSLRRPFRFGSHERYSGRVRAVPPDQGKFRGVSAPANTENAIALPITAP